MNQPVRDAPAAAQKHLDGAASFLAFADSLRSDAQADPTKIGWAITVLFYVAAHVLRAWIVVHHQHQIASHDDMKHAFTDYPELKKSKSDYETLKQESQAARYYLSQRFTWQDFDKLRATTMRIRSTWVSKVQQEIQSAAKPPEAP